MIADPPCIPGLLGCGTGGLAEPEPYEDFGSDSGTDFGDDTSFSSSSSSFESGFSSSNSAGAGDGLFGSFSSSSSSSSRFNPFASNSSSSKAFQPSATDKLATYTISNRNLTSRMLSGVQTAHGSVPISMHFEPSKSSAFCFLQDPSVQCGTMLNSGEVQQLKVAYRVDSRFSCAAEKPLLKAKTTMGYPAPTQQAAEVMTSVDCLVSALPADLLVQVASSNASASGALIGVGSGAVAGTVQSSVSGGVFVLPQTGAEGSYFLAQVDTNSYVQRPVSRTDSFGISPLIYLGILSAALLFWVVRRNKNFGYIKPENSL